MSKYTTEVRYMCEKEAGLEKSVGASNVDEVISSAWDKIFTSTVEFFDENYREFLCKKILKHYYLREIGTETVGIWKLWMNVKLEEIMPYYNQLYKSAQIEFDPMKDVDFTRSSTRDITGNEEANSEGSNQSSGETNQTNWNKYSDTPQGGVTGIENDTYLTNATKVTDNVTNTQNGSETGKTTRETKSADEFNETVTGKQGTGSYAKYLQEYRESMLNIDMMVIMEFKDLFLSLW